MEKEQLQALDREEVIFFAMHEIMHRLMAVEPNSVSIAHDGGASLLTTTEEGSFLATLLATLDLAKRVSQ